LNTLGATLKTAVHFIISTLEDFQHTTRRQEDKKMCSNEITDVNNALHEAEAGAGATTLSVEFGAYQN